MQPPPTPNPRNRRSRRAQSGFSLIDLGCAARQSLSRRVDRSALPRCGRNLQRHQHVTGYAKGYVYDRRLKYLARPKFIDRKEIQNP